MSRVGKKPITIPTGVEVNFDGQTISMKSSKGSLSLLIPEQVILELKDKVISLLPRFNTKTSRALWGTIRARINNIVVGLTKGFEKRLEINGVGYKAALSGDALQLSLGFSHDVVFAIPRDVSIVVPKPTEIVVTGIDPQRVGQIAAEIRSYRPPEPYKGKGTKYSDEFIFRKEGKKK